MKRTQRYIDEDIFNEIEKNYIMVPNKDGDLVGIKRVLVKK